MEAVALVEEMEEDKVKEDEVEEEPPWPMALTFLMSLLDLSLTKNGELSQARADDTSMKNAIGSTVVLTKEAQEKLPQPLP
jgi:hypothetical protein